MRPKSKRAKAACLLLDWLSDQGIKAHGVAHDAHGRKDQKLYAYLLSEADVERVPKSFAGFPVEVSVKDPTDEGEASYGTP